MHLKGSISHKNNSKTLTEWFVTTLNSLPPVISTGKVWSHNDAQHLLNQGQTLLVWEGQPLVILTGQAGGKYKLRSSQATF